MQPLHELHEKRGAFGGFIGPRTLVAQVQNSAPWLFDGSHPDSQLVPETRGERLIEHGFHPLGWWSILRHADLLEAQDEPTPRARTDYFALCLAVHCASVASYVPTDVDAKIRHALWFEPLPEEELFAMRELALYHGNWEIRHISARVVEVEGCGPVSGHDGERLSVLCGGMMGMLAAGRASDAALFEQAVDAELEREARAFDTLCRARGREVELCNLATILTHNVGDVMQAIERKGTKGIGDEQKLRFADLARERFERYGGAFGKAAAIYRELLASEGHRHYPLREQKLLRANHKLLLPLGPFLDDWGAKLARWPNWGTRERAAVAGALLDGCRKVQGQEGYYRALAGFDSAAPGGLESRELASELGSAAKRELKDTTLRKKLAVRRESFESSYAKRARTLLEGWR
ncbi:MAG: hypothetical protein IPJ19_03080 [Planctomycetes bacterium]|nr:hypothetical protein [Planctomycetota bacterium]